MSKIDYIRVWKDPEYRRQLSQEQLASLPENPAGILELSSAELTQLVGGGNANVTSIPCELNDLDYTGGDSTFICCATHGGFCEIKTVGGKLTISS